MAKRTRTREQATRPTEGSYSVPSVPVTIDRPRFLCYDLWSLARLQQVSGKPVSEFNPYFVVRDEETGEPVLDDNGEPKLEARELSMLDCVQLIWAGLTKDDPKLDVETVGHLVHPGNFNDVMIAVWQAWHIHTYRAPQTATDEEARLGPDPLPVSAG